MYPVRRPRRSMLGALSDDAQRLTAWAAETNVGPDDPASFTGPSGTITLSHSQFYNVAPTPRVVYVPLGTSIARIADFVAAKGSAAVSVWNDILSALQGQTTTTQQPATQQPPAQIIVTPAVMAPSPQTIPAATQPNLVAINAARAAIGLPPLQLTEATTPAPVAVPPAAAPAGSIANPPPMPTTTGTGSGLPGAVGAPGIVGVPAPVTLPASSTLFSTDQIRAFVTSDYGRWIALGALGLVAWKFLKG